MAITERYYQELYTQYKDVLTMVSIRTRLEAVNALNYYYDISRKDAKEFIDQKNRKELL